MEYYSYDNITREYTFTGEASESPLEPGEFLLPADATFTSIPLIGANETVLWDGASWIKHIDYRNETWFNVVTGEPTTITDLDVDPVALGMVSTTPQIAINTQAKKDKLTIIAAEQVASAAVDVVYNGHAFQANKAAVSNINNTLTAVANGTSLPADFVWRDSSNQNQPIDAADLAAMAELMFIQTNNSYLAYWAKKDAINALDLDSSSFQTDLDAI